MVKIVRWVPAGYAAAAIAAALRSHNESAMWVFDLDNRYRPRKGVTKGKMLLRYQLDQTAEKNLTTREHIDFEDADFRGERHHPGKIIVKSNEPGSYGIGRTRQLITSLHVRSVAYATRPEVAKALEISVRETGILRSHEPPGGWTD